MGMKKFIFFFDFSSAFDTVKSLPGIAIVDSCFDRFGSRQQGVVSNEVMAEFILGTDYPSETNYMSETDNSSA